MTGCIYNLPKIYRLKKKVFKSVEIYRYDADCSENNFLVREFFFVSEKIFIDHFRYDRFWRMWQHVCKRLKRFLWNMPLTLTSGDKILNPKTCGVQGDNATHQKIFFSQMDKCIDDIFFKISKVFKFTWKMQDVLKRMKNQFSNFCDF